MTDKAQQETLEQWLAQAQAVQERLGAPGIISLAEASALSPQAFFERIATGELPSPPIGELVGFVPIEWGEGRFVFQGTPEERHYNPLGSVHGGYAATLLDSCMGCAIHTRLQQGQGYTTMELRVSYVRALTAATGPVRAIGTVVHVGRSSALAEGRIVDVQGRLYATASTTCMILSAR